MVRLGWGVVLFLAAAVPAWGQQGAVALSSGNRGLYVNPYNSPAFNPFLNPFGAIRPMDGETTMYYFLQAQQQSGGIGSGRLSGSRPWPRGAGERAAAIMPRAAMVPGVGAARYFGRGQATAGRRQPTNGRQNHYFSNNGH